jgi:hypothetical protein
MNSFYEHHKESIRWQYRCRSDVVEWLDSAIPATRTTYLRKVRNESWASSIRIVSYTR